MFFLCRCSISGVKLLFEDIRMMMLGFLVMVRFIVLVVSVMLVEFLLIVRLMMVCRFRCFRKICLCCVCLVL